jgi:cytoskeleton protein RodZ
MATLGEKLRQAREAKGLSLRDVAEITRVAVNYLESIEEDNFKPLPGGIFNKGFVRSFAKAVGVDEQEALADYSNLMAREIAAAPEEENNLKTRRSEILTNEAQPSAFGRILLALIFLGLIGVGVWYALNHWQQISDYLQSSAAPAASPSPNMANSNTGAAVVVPSLASPAPVSTTDGLKAQIKTNTQTVSIEATLDGKKQAFNLSPGETKELTAQNSLRLRYYKNFSNEIQLIINGRAINLPTTPANPKNNGIEFEINRENLKDFVK